jgi:hypothetical protein
VQVGLDSLHLRSPLPASTTQPPPREQLKLEPHWVLDDESFRIGMFLENERDRILLRCIDTVTLRTINHENICLLNTILEIHLIAHRRGQLAASLVTIRKLADERARATQEYGSGPADEDDDMYCMPCTASFTGGDKVMLNYRRLLWFWQEFYLRRGRDRLSIEYATQRPFHYVSEVVQILCADDGAPTSLLRAPCQHIRSPYEPHR